MKMKILLCLNNRLIRYSIYFIGFALLVSFRLTLDKDHLFITSDGQIKYYQTVQIASGEFAQSECLYPGKDIDPDYSYYIFDYPWAFFNTNASKCSFQYSPYFPSLASIVYLSFGERSVTILPLLFAFFSILIFDIFLSRIGIRPWIIVTIAISTFYLSFLSLSALDYAELSLNDFFFTASILYFLPILLHSKEKFIQSKDLFLFSILATSSILLRPESSIGYFFLGIFTLLYYWQSITKQISVYNIFYSILGLSIVLGLFLIVNTIYSGNPLGFRATNTGNDFTSLENSEGIWGNIVTDLWRSNFKSGLFFAVPVLFIGSPVLFIYTFFKSKRNTNLKLGYIFLFSSLASIILIPILSPYRAGFHHFGNRYFETAVILGFIGLAILWNIAVDSWRFRRKACLGVAVLIAICSFYSYRYTNEGFKVLRSSAISYNQMMEFLTEESIDKNRRNLPIVHKSMFTNYLVGYSFLDTNHYLVTSPSELENLEQRFTKAGITSYKLLEYLGKPNYMSDIPRKLFDEKINIQYDIENILFESIDEKQFLEFQTAKRVKVQK